MKWRLAQGMEWRWWKRYLRNRPTEQYLAWKEAYWNALLAATGTAIRPGAKVLDAGCGPAGIFMVLSAQNVTAVDPLLAVYERELPHFQPGRYPWVDFRAVPLESWTPTAEYDAIFCLNALNHFEDLERSITQLTLAARPGGRLLLTVDVHRFRWWERIFQWIPADVLHPHQWGGPRYIALLEAAGWKIERAFPLKKGWIFDYLAVVARKP